VRKKHKSKIVTRKDTLHPIIGLNFNKTISKLYYNQAKLKNLINQNTKKKFDQKINLSVQVHPVYIKFNQIKIAKTMQPSM
jgi:hypothetical protein